VPIQIDSIRVGEIRIYLPGFLIIREQFLIKFTAAHLRELGAQILITIHIIRHLRHLSKLLKTIGGKGEPKSAPFGGLKRKPPLPFPLLRGMEMMENLSGLPHSHTPPHT